MTHELIFEKKLAQSALEFNRKIDHNFDATKVEDRDLIIDFAIGNNKNHQDNLLKANMDNRVIAHKRIQQKKMAEAGHDKPHIAQESLKKPVEDDPFETAGRRTRTLNIPNVQTNQNKHDDD